MTDKGKTSRKHPNSRRNLDIAIDRLAAETGDPLRLRNARAAAIVAQMIPDGVVKGGSALRLRYGSAATRFTRDLDAARSVPLEEFARDLDGRLRAGWEGFTGRLVPREPAHPAGIEPRYVMRPFDAKLDYNGKPWVTVPVEVGHDEIGDADSFDVGVAPDIASAFESLGFPAPGPARLMPLDHQIAQKLHAASARGSERAHDLIDLQLIVRNTPDIDWTRVRATCVRLFAYRQEQAWPPTVVAGERWEEGYAAQAEGLGVLPTAADAVAWVNGLIEQIDAAGREPSS